MTVVNGFDFEHVESKTWDVFTVDPSDRRKCGRVRLAERIHDGPRWQFDLDDPPFACSGLGLWLWRESDYRYFRDRIVPPRIQREVVARLAAWALAALRHAAGRARVDAALEESAA